MDLISEHQKKMRKLDADIESVLDLVTERQKAFPVGLVYAFRGG